MRAGTTLVIDQGGSSSRAIVYSAAGDPLASATRAVATHNPTAGHVEQDPDAVVASLRDAIGEVLPSVDDRARVGFACQRSSIVCWRRSDGAALTPVLSWQDTRARALFDRLELDPVRVHALTGLRPNGHYGASKIAWCIQHVPAVRAAHAAGDLCAGPLASFVLHRLLDERPMVATPTLAQRTLLFDIQTGRWSHELLAAFGLEESVLPAIAPDCRPLGMLGGRPVVACVGDQNAVPFATTAGPETLFVNAGTGAFVLQRADGDAPDGLLRTLLPDGTFAIEGTVNGAGSALAWHETRVGAPVDWSAAAVPRDDAPLFVNTVGDLGSPFWRAGIVPRFEPDTDDADDRAVAVIESIAFLVRANTERMHGRRVRLTGGLAAADGFCRLLAAALGLPVERAADLEATARGVVALLGGSADGAPAQVFEPDPRWSATLDDRYRTWSSFVMC